MANHELLGGMLQLYRRDNSRFWQCSASVGGKQRRHSTKEEDFTLAKQIAEDWFLELRGKDRAGLLTSEKTFRQAAEQFLKEYEVITEGQRSPAYVKGHAIRLRLHLLPFFGDLGISGVTAGKVQAYRVHRMTLHLETKTESKNEQIPSESDPASKKKKKKRKPTPPTRSTLHDEIVTLRQVLKTAIRHAWLDHLPDLSPPYKTQGKIVHRPWFSPEEYTELYKATGKYAKEPFHDYYRWNAEQVHDYVLFMANTGLRPDEAMENNLLHRDVAIVDDDASGKRILEIEVRGKRGVGYCKSMPGAVKPYERLLARAKPTKAESRREAQRRRREGGVEPPPSKPEYPQPTDPVFPGNHLKLFNGVLNRTKLKFDREKNRRTAYSLRHTYICMRLMEGADIYQIAKNCRTSVEMIEKFYAAHIKNTLDAAAINVLRPKHSKKGKKAEEPADTDDEQ